MTTDGYTMDASTTTVRVAGYQTAPVFGDVEGNRRRVVDAVRQAAAAGARLVVLPELAVTGYVFRGLEEARSLAEAVPGPTTDLVTDVCAELGMVAVVGIAELVDGQEKLFNSAAVIDGSGVRAVYRKAHLWGDEPAVFTPGAASPPVIDLGWARIGF